MTTPEPPARPELYGLTPEQAAAESEADFLVRLREIRLDAEARQAWAKSMEPEPEAGS